MLLFVAVVVAASLCVLASAAVLVVAHRSEAAELGLLGGFLMSASILPLVHGITTPGVWYGPNDATLVSVLLAVPVGTVVAAPVLAPRSTTGRAVLRRWRAWVAPWTAGVTVLAVALLVWPDVVPAPEMSSPTAIVIGVSSLLGCVALSLRQLRLSRISRDRGSLTVAIGFALIGTSTLVWLGDRPYNAGFWFAHLVDVAGVFAGCVGALLVVRRTGSTADVLAPIVAVEPVAALELGLDPVVHRFVADLDRKDEITRDHVVRTAELAMRVGARLGVPEADLRDLGLGALLHDIGKIEVPDEILNKPGRLTDVEFAAMQEHAAIGRRIVAGSPGLAAVAPIVGGHHERWDGRGYPDGLAAEDIPLAARIVSACDAFDAMAQTRRYRDGMGVARSLAILSEHAGSQWDERVVEAVRAELADHDVPPTMRALADVGREVRCEVAAGCGCVDALPRELADLDV